VKVTTWIWAAPVVFLIHDAEEIATVEPWLGVHRSELPQPLQPLATITTQQFALAVAVLGIGLTLVSAHGAVRAGQRRLSIPFLIAAGALVGNALTHVLQAAVFRGYTPGVITAVLVVLPYGAGLTRSLVEVHLATWRRCLVAIAAGMLIQAPVAVLALAVGRMF
jgi:hypothetical protein